MANAFTLTSHSYQGRYLYLECSQSVDIAKNQSTITWTLHSKGGEDNYYSTGPTTVTIAGSQVYYCKKMEWDTRQFPAAKGSVSGSLVVDHDTNGNLTIAVGLSTNIYTGVIKSFSGNWTLDNIPRAASIKSAPDFNDTQLPTVTYENPAGSYVEALDICIADDKAWTAYVSYRPVNKTGSLSYTFTASDVTALKNITGNSLALTFVLRTKIGGKYFYNTIPKTFKMTENDDTKPVVSMSVSVNNGSLPSAFNDLYIQGKSRVDVAVSATGKYNAKINSYSGNVDGKAYSGDKFTSDALQNPGTVSIYGYAKDSRGFTGSKLQQIQVIEHSKPLVIPVGSDKAILCYRSDGNGKRTGTSTSVWIKAARSYHKVISGSQKNFCALQWRRKLSTEKWNDSVHKWSDLIARTDLSTDQYNALLPGVEFDITKAYTVQIRAIDDTGDNDPKTLEVPTRDVALHLGKGGKNVSIGSYCDYAEDYTFHSYWTGIFDKGINGTLLNHKVRNDVLTFAEECNEGLTPFITNDLTDKATLPSGSYHYSAGIVLKRTTDQYNVILIDYVTGKIAINVYLSGTWTGWKYITPQ